MLRVYKTMSNKIWRTLRRLKRPSINGGIFMPVRFKTEVLYQSSISRQSTLSSFTVFLLIFLVNIYAALLTFIFLTKSYKIEGLLWNIYKLILCLLSPFYLSLAFLYIPSTKESRDCFDNLASLLSFLDFAFLNSILGPTFGDVSFSIMVWMPDV